jgi:hemerythrin-like domain-containing protein
MRASEVRRRILDDHGWLRAVLDDVEEVARRVVEGDLELGVRLRERAAALRERFLSHLDLEDAFLVPALREADDWGEERAACLAREHASQRERFAVLLDDLRDPHRNARDVAREVRALVHDLRLDMEHEERSMLAPDLLRDDPITVDVETG